MKVLLLRTYLARNECLKERLVIVAVTNKLFCYFKNKVL